VEFRQALLKAARERGGSVRLIAEYLRLTLGPAQTPSARRCSSSEASVIPVAAAICSPLYRPVPSGRGTPLRVTQRPIPTLNVTGLRDGV
jgi:hypothetical protein